MDNCHFIFIYLANSYCVHLYNVLYMYLAEEGETTHLCKRITDFYAIVWNVHFCVKGVQIITQYV